MAKERQTVRNKRYKNNNRLVLVREGTLDLTHGEGSFVVEADNKKFQVLAELLYTDDPNVFPNCGNPTIVDSLSVKKVHGGFQVAYDIQSPHRKVEWALVEFLNL